MYAYGDECFGERLDVYVFYCRVQTYTYYTFYGNMCCLFGLPCPVHRYGACLFFILYPRLVIVVYCAINLVVSAAGPSFLLVQCPSNIESNPTSAIRKAVGYRSVKIKLCHLYYAHQTNQILTEASHLQVTAPPL